MKTIGLIGGLSWHSTAQYYRVLNEEVQARLGGHASASIALQSLDFSQVRAHQQTGDWAAAGRLLADAGRRCQDAGADVVLICSNLMHRVADDVEAALDVPLLRITDAIADRARDQGWSRLGVLGARWVMEEDFYVGRLARTGLQVQVPEAADRTVVDRVIFDELTQGRVVDAVAHGVQPRSSGGSQTTEPRPSCWAAPRSSCWSARPTHRCRCSTRCGCTRRRRPTSPWPRTGRARRGRCGALT